MVEEINKLEQLKQLPLPELGTEIGSGALFGYASGFASKVLLKYAVLGFGLGFIGLQLLQNQGLINVEWRKLEGTLENALDLNNDGKIDEKDLQIAYDRYIKTLTYRYWK
jgi:uncharacterized membrane protein (Fun14 family)